MSEHSDNLMFQVQYLRQWYLQYGTYNSTVLVEF